jgi:tetratricopeptide (TPR) repeat protein
MAEWETRRKMSPSLRDSSHAHEMRGNLALNAKQYAQAQTELRAADVVGCPICNAAMLARAYDLDGKPDSAIAVYERYLNTSILERTGVDGVFLPAVHKRLGELYEAKGQRDRALAHYRVFLDLWKDADPELQPKVTDARQRVAALTRGTDARR